MVQRAHGGTCERESTVWPPSIPSDIAFGPSALPDDVLDMLKSGRVGGGGAAGVAAPGGTLNQRTGNLEYDRPASFTIQLPLDFVYGSEPDQRLRIGTTLDICDPHGGGFKKPGGRSKGEVLAAALVYSHKCPRQFVPWLGGKHSSKQKMEERAEKRRKQQQQARQQQQLARRQQQLARGSDGGSGGSAPGRAGGRQTAAAPDASSSLDSGGDVDMEGLGGGLDASMASGEPSSGSQQQPSGEASLAGAAGGASGGSGSGAGPAAALPAPAACPELLRARGNRPNAGKGKAYVKVGGSRACAWCVGRWGSPLLCVAVACWFLLSSFASGLLTLISPSFPPPSICRSSTSTGASQSASAAGRESSTARRPATPVQYSRRSPCCLPLRSTPASVACRRAAAMLAAAGAAAAA